MMEPTTTGLIAWVAGISALALAVFGFDYYSLLYALAGAMFALLQSEQMTWGRAIVYTLLATLAGAALGNIVAAYVTDKPTRATVIGFCFLGGLIASALASALLKAAPRFADIAVVWLEKMVGRVFGNQGDKP